MNKKLFSPLIFLASLGAGGISVIPFAFFNYTIPHGKGLIYISTMPYGDISFWQTLLYRIMEGGMIVFALLHIILSVVFFIGLWGYLKTDKYKDLIKNPLENSAILAPFISITMTLNMFIGPIRYFLPAFAENLQIFMVPALVVWAVIWAYSLVVVVRLLKISFVSDFDVNKISFGWLLYPFVLAMVTVTGTGIAAIAHNSDVANVAAFMSLISGTMGMFLFAVKLMSIFKSHFAATSLPEKQFLPSFLIVIPNITLYAISIFRFGHYLEHHYGAELGVYFMVVTVTAFAFEVWYMFFGLSLLKDYFKRHFFREFHVTQWGLICPLVAFAVLGIFVHKVFVQSTILYIVILLATLISALAFFALLIKQARCVGILKSQKTSCN